MCLQTVSRSARAAVTAPSGSAFRLSSAFCHAEASSGQPTCASLVEMVESLGISVADSRYVRMSLNSSRRNSRRSA